MNGKSRKDTTSFAGTKDTKESKDTKDTRETASGGDLQQAGEGRSGLRVASPLSAEVEALVHEVIGAAMEVHSRLGSGMLESVYRDAMTRELELRGHRPRREVGIQASYKELRLKQYRADLVVNGVLMVEIKAVVRVLPVHKAQVLSYLKLSGLRIGLLLNFRVPHMREGIRRFVL